MFEPAAKDAGTQEKLPDPPEDAEETELKIRPCERIKQYPKAPIEPSAYGRGLSYSRKWILEDGRALKHNASEMHDKYRVPRKLPAGIGIRKQLLTDFFWEQMLGEVLDEMAAANPTEEYCSEYECNYVKEDFQPRDLSQTSSVEDHIKYPLYGAGSSPITFYTETIKKKGVNILDKFRTSQDFTKPLDERFDNGWVL